MAVSDHFLLFHNADGHYLWATANVFSYLENGIDVASSQMGGSSCLMDLGTERMITHMYSGCGPAWYEGTQFV